MKINTLNQSQEAKELAHPESFVAEEKFRLLVESVKDYGIFLMDPNGHIQSWNEGAERIKGYTASEIIGKHFSIFYTEKDLRSHHPEDELRIATEKGRYEEEGWRVRKNGTTFWANIVITALRDKDNKLIGFAKVTRDLTERKEMEDKLRRSEERARKMFEDIKDYSLISLTSEGTVASWNEGARRIIGYEAKEILGRHYSIFSDAEDRKMGKCDYELKEAFETGRFEDEGWRIRKDGTKFWANVSLTPIRNDSGLHIGFTMVTRDMTERKRSDDLLRMAYSNLERRIEERTKELLLTNEKLQEAIHVRDEFLSIASHELRTPLTPLKLQVQGLLAGIRKGTLPSFKEDRLERMAETCEKAISRLSNLIENLLDVSRINMGRLVLNFEKFDLVNLAQEIIERYRTQILASGSEVNLHTNEPVEGHFDRLRMEQVLVNLLTNGLKYGKGLPIDITVTIESGVATLEFKDQGLGIEPQHHEKIFQRFERINSSDTLGGMGLGLFITKQIVEAHGGTISVQSTLGHGATFIVKLPLRRSLD